MPRGLHHVELWVPSLDRTRASWGWLLEELGFTLFQQWGAGLSWQLDDVYVVFEQSRAMTADSHDRTRPGLNHLALHGGTRAEVDRLVAAAPEHGWELMFADRHPHAGGPDSYAGYLADRDGYEVELVADEP
jgi:catechol 2,3-dioxygenase-like lactoylglutathione lyase family enzyme